MLDLRPVALIADYFVIATAESDRQLRATREAIEAKLKESGVTPLSMEGTPASGWVLLDYGSIVVHLFSAEQREFYRLEELWHNAKTVVRMA